MPRAKTPKTPAGAEPEAVSADVLLDLRQQVERLTAAIKPKPDAKADATPPPEEAKKGGGGWVLAVGLVLLTLPVIALFTIAALARRKG